jgi:glutaredoxin
LQAWAESLEGITFPLLSDFWPHGEIARRYGVFREDGTAERAIFIMDADGVVQYAKVHDIDQRPDNEVLFAELERIVPEHVRASTPREARDKPPGEARVDSGDAEAGDESGPDPRVVMYCNNWCPDCRRARVWLERHEIEYREINVSRDREAAQQVREWADGNLVTPTFNIQGEIVIDWDEAALSKLLL